MESLFSVIYLSAGGKFTQRHCNPMQCAVSVCIARPVRDCVHQRASVIPRSFTSIVAISLNFFRFLSLSGHWLPMTASALFPAWGWISHVEAQIYRQGSPSLTNFSLSFGSEHWNLLSRDLILTRSECLQCRKWVKYREGNRVRRVRCFEARQAITPFPSPFPFWFRNKMFTSVHSTEFYCDSLAFWIALSVSQTTIEHICALRLRELPATTAEISGANTRYTAQL